VCPTIENTEHGFKNQNHLICNNLHINYLQRFYESRFTFADTLPTLGDIKRKQKRRARGRGAWELCRRGSAALPRTRRTTDAEAWFALKPAVPANVVTMVSTATAK
jgi:hypothetical protein